MILGDILPAQGDVLYLALEDSKRRLQRRMSKLLPAGIPWPRHLTLKTEWRRLHEGGLDDIRAWHAHSKSNGGKPVLAVIDVLANVRKPTGNKQLYEADYEALTGLTQLAGELCLDRCGSPHPQDGERRSNGNRLRVIRYFRRLGRTNDTS
jgi:hypothetical protein